MILATKTTATHQFTVHLYDFNHAVVRKQPINPKTGKVWQAARPIARFQDNNAKGKAMFAFAKLAK